MPRGGEDMNRNMRRRATRTTGPRGGARTTRARGVVGPRGGRYREVRTRGGNSRTRGTKRVYLGAS